MLYLLLALLSSPVQASDWPSLSEPPPSEKLGANDAAVVIGIGDYIFVDDIDGAVDNANDWYGWLVKTRGIPMSSVHVLRDQQATREKLLSEAKWASTRVKPGGTTWYIFIGHGAPSKDGRDGLLVGSDVQQTADSLYARAVPQSELLGVLQGGTQAQTMLVVDACFSGKDASGTALVDNLQPMIPTASLTTHAATVLSAGLSDQFAGPLPGGARPAFSYLLLGALRGWGDENGDGQVTATEAIDYVAGALSGMLTDRSQTPQLVGPATGAKLSTGSESGPDLFSMVRDGSVLTRGQRSQPGNDDDILGDVGAITAQLKAAKALEAQLATARETALSAGASALQTKATSTWSALGELRELGGDVAASKVEAFIAKYAESEVTYTDALGSHQRSVAIAEVDAARLWVTGLTEWLSPTLGTKFVRIEGGRFTMGSPSNEADREDDEVQHQVTLTSAYYLMAHEVTQGEWERVMGSNPAATGTMYWSGEEQGACASYADVSLVGSDKPVMCVSWHDAVAFANGLSKRDGLMPAYVISGETVSWTKGANGYRLPTEAEWEYAARAGGEGLFSGASSYESVCDVGNVADLGAAAKFGWEAEASRKCRDRHEGLAPVGSYHANAWGLYDMTGNVWEWAWDFYGDYPSGSAIDPAGASTASYRVNRGGSWSSNRGPRHARVADRSRNTPSYRSSLVGFRLARSE